MSNKPSFYNIHATVDGRSTVFNTFTGALIELDDISDRALSAGDLSRIHNESVDALREQGFVVDANRDETAEYLEEYEKDKETPGTLLCRLMLATSCNLGCAYCYQGAPEKKRDIITKPDLQRFLKWVDGETASPDITKVHIDLYGGEPLLARIHLPWFFAELQQIQQRNNVDITYSITTNATLLNNDLIDLLVSNKVASQITIDGPKNCHDERRIWKNGKGSFDQIVNNVKKMVARGGCDLITIRINFDRDNYQEVGELIPFLHDLGVQRVECGWIQFRGGEHNYLDKVIDSEELDAKIDRELYAIMKPFGYVETVSDISRKSVCSVHRKNDFMFTPQLEAFKCDELIDNPEHRIGRIDENSRLVLEGVNYEKQTSRKPTDFESCPTCRFLPICGCGCQVAAMKTKGDMHKNYCEVTTKSMEHKIRNLLFQEEYDSREIVDATCCSNGSCGCGE
jgi:uncharacterized protein